jgi:diguanylate cyclase (GGDEF)-like protein
VAGGTSGAPTTLLPGTAAAGARTPAKATGRTIKGAHTSSAIHSTAPGALAAASEVLRFINVVPTWIWLALAFSLTLAAIGGATALRSRAAVRRQAGHFAAVAAAALTDPLTGVLNRRGFMEAAERELARARRYHRPFVLAYVDVRGLKGVNDTEGHLAGDRLLTEVADMLKESARADDVVGRLGGDELGLLVAEQTAAGAAVVIDRIRSQVPVRRAEMGMRAKWDLTIGTAAFPDDGDTLEDLLSAADRRLYEQRGISLTN